MNSLDLLVCEFDLSSADAAMIRKLVSALNLCPDDPAVVQGVRATLANGGIQAFALDFHASIWSLEIGYNVDDIVPDTEQVAAEVQRLFHANEIRWRPWTVPEKVAAGFGFSCPETWMAPLPEAFGRVIRNQLHEVVLANSRRVSRSETD